MAAQNGHKDIVNLLLKEKADVNAKNKKGATPLHLAAQNGHKDIVNLLLKEKADVNAKNKKGATPLHFAAENDHTYIVDLLLKEKADVNAKNKKGATPLHFAAKNGHTYIVDLLLKEKADVNAKNKKGATPLHFAAKNDRIDIVDLLLSNPNINVGCIDLKLITGKSASKKNLVQKRLQDNELFNMLKQAATEIDENKVDELLESKNKYSFKPSLNYSPDGNNENTTIEIAIKAGGKLLDLLCTYAEKNIGTDTEIFKRLKHAKENSHSKRDLCDVSVLKHSTPDQGFLFSNG